MKTWMALFVVLVAGLVWAGDPPYPDDLYNRPGAVLYGKLPNGTYVPLRLDPTGGIALSGTTGQVVTAVIYSADGTGFSATITSGGAINVNMATAFSSSTDWVSAIQPQGYYYAVGDKNGVATVQTTTTFPILLMGTSGGGSLTTSVITGPPPVNGDPILNRGWCLSYFTQTTRGSDPIKSSAGVLCDVESMSASVGQYMTLTDSGGPLLGYFTGTAIGPLFDCGIPLTFTTGLRITPGNDGRAPGLYHIGYK